MTLRISFSTGALYHLPLRTTFALAHEAGLDGVELVYCPEVALRGSTPIRRLSREYSLPVLSIHPSVVPYPGGNRIARILPHLTALAEDLECPLVVVHTPRVSTLEEPNGKQWLEALLRERERKSHLRITVENAGLYQPSDARFALHDVARLRDLADRYDLSLTLDTAHAGTSPCGVLGVYNMLRHRVVNVHFSDILARHIVPNWRPLQTVLSHHQLPGTGRLPLAEFARALVADGYAGPFTLEVSPIAIKAWDLARTRRILSQAVEQLRRLTADNTALPEAQ